MTHTGEAARKEAALNAIFAKLNDQGKDSALAILKALSFAQSVMNAKTGEMTGPGECRRPTRAG